MKKLLLLLFSMVACWTSYGQQNLALQATAAHSGGGATNFGPQNYNDGVIAVGTNQPWGWVSSNGWIEYTWTTPVTFQDILLYDGGRKLSGGVVEVWDAGTSSYVTVLNNLAPFISATQGVIDSVVLPTRVTTTKLRFNSLSGSNPNFREIEVYEAPTGLHDAGVISTSNVAAVCPGSYPVSVTIQNFGINRIDSVMVNWSVDGVAQTPVWHTSQLDTVGGTGMNSAVVALGNYSFATNTTYQLKSWTSMPNSAADTTNMNDTLNAQIALGAPTGFAANNVMTTSAGLSWNSLGGTNFRITYGAPGFNPQSAGSTVTATGTTTTLTSLTANTPYEAYLVADCGGSVYSDTTGPISFRTPCTISTAPFSENFDDPVNWVSRNTIDPCWSASPSAGSTWSWEPRSNAPTSGNGPLQDLTGNNFMYCEASISGTFPDAELISPPIDVSGLTTPGLYFFQHRFSGATIADMDIEVSNDFGTTWNNVYNVTGDIQSSNSDPWELEFVNLVAYTGDTIMVKFKQHFNGCCGDAAIDSVVVDEAPTCPWPTSLAMTNRTDSSVTIGWNDPTGTNWELQWGPPGFTQASPGAGTKTTSYNPDTITGLQSNTEYEVYVRTDCGPNGQSIWIGPITVRTSCSPFMAPYSDNFDNSPNNAVPYCWANYITGGRTTNGVAQTYQFATPVSSPNHIRFYNGSPATSADTTLLISPKFSDLTAGDKRVQFMAQSSTTLVNELVVGTMGDPMDALSFNALDTVALTTTYQLYVVNLDAAAGYNGTDEYVAFRHGNSATFRTIYIDNFLYEMIPLCNPPLITTLGVAGVSPTSATIYWGAGSDGFETHWEVGPVGFTPGTNSYTSADSVAGNIDTTVAAGLTAQTNYEFYIRDSCASNGYSPWVGPFSFTTACNIFTAPLSEDFDGTSWVASGSNAGNSLDPCWTSSPDVSDGVEPFKWIPRSTGPTSGNGPLNDKTGVNYLYCEASGSSANDVAYLYSPIVDVSALTVPALYFSQHRYSGATIADMDIEVTNDFGATWTNVYSVTGDIQTSNSDPWQDEIIPLGAYVGDTIQIRFVQTGNGCCGDAAIDDVEIKEAPTCPDVISLLADSITDTTATLSWIGNPNTGSYQIWFGPQGFYQSTSTAGGTKVFTSLDSLMLDSLRAQSCYEFLVRGVCAPGDTGNWVGPVIFCTDLGYDAELVDIERPDGCGSVTSDIKAIVRNNGDYPIGGFPINVTLSGTLTNTFNTTYSGTLVSGATDTVLMGTVNTVNGAVVTYEGYVGLAKDQILSNDSLRFDSVFTIPLDPVAYDTTFCVNQDTATLLALPIPGVGYNWFANTTDTVPLYSGNPYEFPIATAQSTYYIEYANNADSLSTPFVGGNGQAGNSFDILPLTNLTVTGVDINVDNTAAHSVNVYYKTGTYVGFNTALAGWTLHETVAVTGAGAGQPTPVPFTNPINLNANQVYGMMIVLTTGTNIDYTNGTTTGAVLAQNSDLIIYEGAGVSWPLGSNFNPRFWNGTIHYGGVGCSNARLPVNLTIGSDTTVAAFSATPAGGLTMNFDASATVNGDHYAWDFGDGNMGTGVTTSHTYGTSNSYTVTLTVSDSTGCYSTGVADTTFTLNVGLNENALQRSVVIYPNPSSGVVNISFTTESQSAMIRITDAAGKEVMRVDNKNINKHFSGTIDIGKLSKGVYMIEINDGSLSAVQRLIKD